MLAGSNFHWKPSSQEYLIAGNFKHFSDPIGLNVSSHPWKRSSSIVLLGAQITDDASSRAFFEYRLQRADMICFKIQNTLKADIGVLMKLRAWHTRIQAAVIYGCETLHVTKAILLRARAWENRWLRKILRIRRMPDETPENHMKRAARIIGAAFTRTGIPRLTVRLLDQVARSALDRDPDLDACRYDRDEAWWNLARTASKRQRVSQSSFKPRQGKRSTFERPFVQIFGPLWRSEQKPGKAFRSSFVSAALSLFGLSPPPSASPPPSRSSSFAPSPSSSPSPSKWLLLGDLRLSELPLPHRNPADEAWAKDGTVQMESVTDCQALAGFLNGSNRYDGRDESIISLLQGLGELMFGLFSTSLKPRRTILDPVRWRRRCWNFLADGLCLRAIKTQKSELFISSTVLEELKGLDQHPHIQTHSDGSTLLDLGVSAAACTIIVWCWREQGWTRRLLAVQTKFFDSAVSSLRAETEGLHMAVSLTAALFQAKTSYFEGHAPQLCR